MKKILAVLLLFSLAFAGRGIDFTYYSMVSDTCSDTTSKWISADGAYMQSLTAYNMSADSTAYLHFYNSSDTASLTVTEANLWFAVPAKTTISLNFAQPGIMFDDRIQLKASRDYNAVIAPDSTVLISITIYDED